MRKQRDAVTCPKSHSLYMAKLGFEPSLSKLQGVGVQPLGHAGFGQLWVALEEVTKKSKRASKSPNI